jgi:hypothetical protein
VTIVTAQPSQSTIDSTGMGLSKSQLEKATKLYVAMTESETNKTYQQYLKKYKVGLNHCIPVLKNGSCLEWMEQNLAKTNFGSIAEVADIEKKTEELNLKIFEENPELEALLVKASREQYPIIMANHNDYFNTLK